MHRHRTALRCNALASLRYLSFCVGARSDATFAFSASSVAPAHAKHFDFFFFKLTKKNSIDYSFSSPNP